LLISGTIFGVIHCAGWNLPFPTYLEQKLWHVASVAVAIFPIAAIPFAAVIVLIPFIIASVFASVTLLVSLIVQLILIVIFFFISRLLSLIFRLLGRSYLMEDTSSVPTWHHPYLAHHPSHLPHRLSPFVVYSQIQTSDDTNPSFFDILHARVWGC
jgi:hypothetical protein